MRGPPMMVLEHQWWADASVNGGLSVRWTRLRNLIGSWPWTGKVSNPNGQSFAIAMLAIRLLS
jgi:hypothetical protein